MKVGDKLYCHTKKPGITVGNIYTVYCNNVPHYIINDNNHRNYYSLQSLSIWYYDNWFYTEKDLRKYKLDKINESRR